MESNIKKSKENWFQKMSFQPYISVPKWVLGSAQSANCCCVNQPPSNNYHPLSSGNKADNRDMKDEILVGQKRDAGCSWLVK